MLTPEERKLSGEIYEYGEIEREAAMLADFATQGGFWFRFWKWIERICREEREYRIDERAALRERE
ncbi:hypothetical protein [Brucella haematophila]|uniref:Uncharacterized protein n=1 Tax=Brucella haematophila TaxID=419474 RepID=A0ABX1DND1_9HYPH|nr:hypothetical protein [Brucella haematophila]NKC04469.1 hypothetical protein [Brucella haematophila]TMV03833.1 hypothetical protein FGI60_07590 [Brucella haematophila]